MSGFTSSGGGSSSSSSSSSSSIGGGNSTYSNKSNDFVATATAGAKTIVLSSFANSVLSSALTVESWANAVIKRISSSGDVDTLPITNIAWNSGTFTLTLADMTAVFASGDTVEVFVTGPDKGFVEASDVSKVKVTDGSNDVQINTVNADAVSNTRNSLLTTSRLVGYNGSTWDRLQVDASKYLKIGEQYAPNYEDQTNGVAGTQNKPLAVSTYAWSIDKSAALEASSVTKAAAGVLRAMGGRIDSTHASGTYYLQVLNHASLPSDGAVTFLLAPLKLVHTLGTDTNFSIDCTMNGVYASTGITWCLSTTEFTKTISGAFVSANVLYI